MLKVAIQFLGLAIVLAGVVDLVLAQTDGCAMTIYRDTSAHTDHLVAGCNTQHVCNAGTNPPTRCLQMPYSYKGETWISCYCPLGSGTDCMLLFRTDPETGSGFAECAETVVCAVVKSAECEVEELPTVDPEVKELTCRCDG